MAFTTSPNMSLIIPGVGTELGPAWANDLNSSLAIIDQHNHSPGSGVQINPDGLDINTDLSMGGNNLTITRSVRFQPQSAALSLPTDLGCVYEAGVDLYYNDGNGNQIRLTQGGSIVGTAGSITGLPSGTASASYSAGTFTFQSATSTPANIDAGSYVFRNTVANSFGLTLSPPNAMGSNYSLTLPPLPGSTNIMTLSAAGNMAATLNVDSASLTISSNQIQVNTQGIQQSMIALRSGPSSTVGAGGVAVSASSGVFIGSAGPSPVPVTNLSITITTLGNPVMAFLQGDGVNSDCFLAVEVNAGHNNNPGCNIQINRGGTVVDNVIMGVGNTSGNVDGQAVEIPPGAIQAIDFPPPGTYNYTISFTNTSSEGNFQAQNVILVVYEIK